MRRTGFRLREPLRRLAAGYQEWQQQVRALRLRLVSTRGQQPLTVLLPEAREALERTQICLVRIGCEASRRTHLSRRPSEAT